MISQCSSRSALCMPCIASCPVSLGRTHLTPLHQIGALHSHLQCPHAIAGVSSSRWAQPSPAAARCSAQKLHATKTEALIFDCDGVILLSEETHRVAYNLAFKEFNVVPKGEGDIAEWSVKYYEVLQNSVGGGKPKMHHFFKEFGYPTSTLQDKVPETDADKTALVDELQAWKTTAYQDLIASGDVPARPNVNRIHDEARELGLKVGVCSAATKSSALVVLESLMGQERFKALDVLIAGDDVDKKKPDPMIYVAAAERLGLDPAACMCIEDSTIGLMAALGAGMRCMITYHEGTINEDFHGATHIMAEFKDDMKLADLLKAEDWTDDRAGRQDA